MKNSKDTQFQITGKLIMEAGVLLMVVDVLTALGIWQAISNHWQVAEGGSLFFEAFIRAGAPVTVTAVTPEQCYILFLSVVFSFLGNRVEMVLWANLFLQLLGVIFFYRGSRKLLGYFPGLITAVIAGGVSGFYFSIVRDDPMHLTWCAAGLVYFLFAVIMRWLFKSPEATTQTIEAAASDMQETFEIERTEEVRKGTWEEIAKEAGMDIKEPLPSVKLIENPLPVPKKHVKKEMDYAFEPAPEQMHYDLNNYRVDDDYDIKNVV